MKEKIGLIGVGNMGTAILEGLLEKKVVDAGQVMVFDKITEKAAEFSGKWKVRVALSNFDVAKNSDVTILAVKPQDLAVTAAEISVAALGKVVISILAGMPVSKIKQVLTGARVVRSMPNLGAMAGEGMTAITSEDAAALEVAEHIFSASGKVVKLEEKYFNLVTAISGSGPAYFFLLMELLIEEGKKNGLKEADAQLLAVQTALGAAKYAEKALGKETPAELRARVTSKGGTTEAALNIFNKHKIADIVSEAVTAAVNRGKELAGGK